MVPATPPRRPWFRLQFSLRAVLVLMALVGIGLVIYRWPWERVLNFPLDKAEGFAIPLDSGLFHGALGPAPDFREEKAIPARVVTTFRRDWRGKPIAHGPHRYYVAGVLLE